MRFTVRSLLLAILCVGIGMSWIANRYRYVRRQRVIAKTLQSAGAAVFTHDWMIDAQGRRVPTPAEHGYPKFLERLLGRDLFTNVVEVDMSHSEDVTSYLHLVSELRDLKRLYAEDTAIGDAELETICNLAGIETLSLKDTAVSDDGLRIIGQMKSLRELDLDRTVITDEGLRHLRSLRGLERLSLDQTAIEGRGLIWLRDLCNLQWLDLTGTRIENDAVESLSRMQALEKLFIEGTALDLRGVEALKKRLPNTDIWFETGNGDPATSE